MIEAFFSGKAGLTSHQNSLDVIANNVANVNTTGYKSKVQDFAGLLSASEVRPDTANSANLIAGSGSKTSSVATDMTNGGFSQTDSKTDYYINGDGFFAVKDNSGNTFYTRDGHFQIINQNGRMELATSAGMTVQDRNGNPVTVNAAGNIGTPGVFTFPNAPGLISRGENLFAVSNTSGTAAASATVPMQGMLENSNVDLAQQMVDLITAQRGYQLNSGVVSTANGVEDMINNLGR